MRGHRGDHAGPLLRPDRIMLQQAQEPPTLLVVAQGRVPQQLLQHDSRSRLRHPSRPPGPWPGNPPRPGLAVTAASRNGPGWWGFLAAFEALADITGGGCGYSRAPGYLAQRGIWMLGQQFRRPPAARHAVQRADPAIPADPRFQLRHHIT